MGTNHKLVFFHPRIELEFYQDNEAYQEWIDYQNQLVDQYPQLLAMYDAEGNAVINTSDAYVLLAKKRQEATKAALEEKKAQAAVADNSDSSAAVCCYDRSGDMGCIQQHTQGLS